MVCGCARKTPGLPSSCYPACRPRTGARSAPRPATHARPEGRRSRARAQDLSGSDPAYVVLEVRQQTATECWACFDTVGCEGSTHRVSAERLGRQAGMRTQARSGGKPSNSCQSVLPVSQRCDQIGGLHGMCVKVLRDFPLVQKLDEETRRALADADLQVEGYAARLREAVSDLPRLLDERLEVGACGGGSPMMSATLEVQCSPTLSGGGFVGIGRSAYPKQTSCLTHLLSRLII